MKSTHLIISENATLDYSFLSGKTILITGATGLIGKAIIKTLLQWNKMETNHIINIVAVVRNIEKAKKYFGDNNIQYIVGDICNVDFGSIHSDYIIHTASQTSSQSFVDRPVETITTAIIGTKNVLDYAVKTNASGLVYLSSMEVYGTPETDEKITETYATNIDVMKVRSCYSESKRMCENMCISYMSEYKLPVAILRLTQTFGEGVVYEDKRIFAEFARCVIENRDIILKTTGSTKRAYLYLYDAVTAIFIVILKSAFGEAYNVANEETYCSIYEMAQMVAHSIAKGKISVKIRQENIDKLGFAPTLHMNLDSSKIKRLGWKPSTNLEEMFKIMISDMQVTSQL